MSTKIFTAPAKAELGGAGGWQGEEIKKEKAKQFYLLGLPRWDFSKFNF